MFYEEKVIGNSIYFRTVPKGKWKCKTAESAAFKTLMSLSPIERSTVLKRFCTYCGQQAKFCECREDY